MSARSFIITGAWLGPTGSFATFNESSLPTYVAGMLGQIFAGSDGKLYRLVKFDNGTHNVAAGAGKPAYWIDKTAGTVTSDLGDSVGNMCAGGFLCTVTDGNYCFVQMGGRQTVVTDGNADIADFAVAIADAAFNGVAAAALGGNIPYGVFVTADGAGTSADMDYIVGNLL